MKKTFSVLLAAILILSMLSGTAYAADAAPAAIRSGDADVINMESHIPETDMTVIDTIALAIDPPAVGEEPSYIITVPEGAGYRAEDYKVNEYIDVYYQNGVGWAEDMITQKPGSFTFKPGKTYSLLIYLTLTDDSHEFAADSGGIRCTLNGQPATVGFITRKKVLMIHYIFDRLEDARILGDADGDGKATVLDATMIQRRLAQLPLADSFDETSADVDQSGSIDVTDATFIQRYDATLKVPYPIGETIR